MSRRSIFKRLLLSIPLLVVMTFVSFALMYLAPGDPAERLIDPSASAEDMAQIRENLGLNKPVPVQYGIWLGHVVKGDLGVSLQTGQPVLDAIMGRLPATLLLSVSSFALILLITFPLGIWTGARAGSLFDHAVTVLSFLGMALPTFWVGLMMILLFSLKLGWFPSSGFMDPGLSAGPLLAKAQSVLTHMILPLTTIVIGGTAGLIRYNRFGIIQILDQDYIKAATARGISRNRVLFRHALKNAALPIVTILGLSLPGLIGGSFVIEYIFAWPGMGQLGINAIFARDYPILMGTILMSSILIIVGNLLADILYSAIDPRVADS